MDQEQIHNVSMEEIILRQLSRLQLYQVPVAHRMILLEVGLCFLNFWFFEIQNFCLPKLVLCCWIRDYVQMDTNSWDKAIGWEPAVIKSCAPTPQTWPFFDSCLFVLFTSQSCGNHVPCLRGTGPLKTCLEFLKKPTSSILIASVRWHLTYHLQDNFTLVHHFVSAEENSAWDHVLAFAR